MVARGLLFILLFIFIPAIPAPALVQKQSTDIPADALITLDRGGLRITIVAAGRVDVQGQTFDFDIAAIRMRISREEMSTLIGEFDRINFFSLSDRYRDAADGCSRDGRVHEVATLQATSFTVNGKSKSITRWPYECLQRDGSPYPPDLVALEAQVEAVINLHKR